MLAHAQQVRIGGYLLQVELDPGHDPAADATRMLPASGRSAAPPARPAPPPQLAPTPPAPPPAPAPAAAAYVAASPRTPTPAPTVAPASNNPFADLLGPASAVASGGNPFADLLNPAPASVVPAPAAPASDPFADLLPPPAGVDARSSAFVLTPPPPPRLPDDFDPFAPPRPAAATVPAKPVDPFSDLGAGAAPASIDQLFDLGPRARVDPLPDFLLDAGAPAAQPGAARLSTDPLLLFGDAASPPPSAAPVQPDNLPALNAAYSPPRPRPAGPPEFVAPVAPPFPTAVAAPSIAAAAAPMAAAARPSAGDAEALWAAFCEGAGIDLPLPRAAGPALMKSIGQILSSAVAGTLQLMAVRASTKHELRANMTMIQQRSNNPLKFTPDAKSGIEQLVQPAARGFLEGPAAMDDAMHDLVGHSIGTVAGMRAAIEGMLDRFDPAALEALLTRGSVLDSLLPMNRRARLWDLYLQHHRAIRDEAQEDFHTLFGKAFLSAYEQQIDRLKKGNRPQ